MFGYPQLEFIGHKLEEGIITIQEDKVENIRDAILLSRVRCLTKLIGHLKLFIELKSKLVSSPILQLPKGRKRFRVTH